MLSFLASMALGLLVYGWQKTPWWIWTWAGAEAVSAVSMTLLTVQIDHESKLSNREQTRSLMVSNMYAETIGWTLGVAFFGWSIGVITMLALVLVEYAQAIFGHRRSL